MPGTHIAATWDINGEAKLYVDADTPVTVAHTGKNFPFSAVFRFGRPGSEQRYYNGVLDEVLVFDYVLSSTEVSDIYNDTKLPDDSPLLWYKLDETSGDIAKESVGTMIYVSLPEPVVDVATDGSINFEDFAVLMQHFFDSQVFPY